jgi:hypothetical protein
VVLTLGLAAPCLAQTSFPMITHTTPVAVQRGKTTEVLVQGKMNFYGAYQVLVEGEGVQAEVVGAKADTKPPKPLPQVAQVKLKLTVNPDAAPGVREFRVATTLGISSIGQILVVDDPVIEEAKDNNTLDKAQVVAIPSVLVGKLEVKEDLDFFKFTAKEGEYLSFEMFCARIQDKIHDLQNHAKPMLVLYDEEGRELAANDTFYFADPLLTYKVTRSGTYYLQVRESTYDGDPRWVYAVVATNKPYASHVYPMAGNPGKMMQVEPVGSAKQIKPRVSLQVPDRLGVQQIQLDLGGVKTNPVTFIVSDLPQVLEEEGNDTPDKATRVTVPCGINGRLEKNRDLDHFIFKGTKGKAILFEVKARRFGTLLNSTAHVVLDVMNARGDVIAGSMDTHGRRGLHPARARPEQQGRRGGGLLHQRRLGPAGFPAQLRPGQGHDWPGFQHRLVCAGETPPGLRRPRQGGGQGLAAGSKVQPPDHSRHDDPGYAGPDCRPDGQARRGQRRDHRHGHGQG